MLEHPPSPAGSAVTNKTQEAADFLCSKDRLLVYLLVSLASTKLTSSELLSISLESRQYGCLRCRILLNFETSVCPFLQIPEVLLADTICLSTAPPNYATHTDLLRVLSAPSPTSLTKMLNSTGPVTDPWFAPQKTVLQLDFAPLITWKKNVPVNKDISVSVRKAALLLL